MINLDSVGSGSGLRVSGDRWLTRHLAETAQDMDIALSVRRGGQGGSDHANFRAAWVPVVFFVGDDLSRINTPADNMEHVNPRLVGDATGTDPGLAGEHCQPAGVWAVGRRPHPDLPP